MQGLEWRLLKALTALSKHAQSRLHTLLPHTRTQTPHSALLALPPLPPCTLCTDALCVASAEHPQTPTGLSKPMNRARYIHCSQSRPPANWLQRSSPFVTAACTARGLARPHVRRPHFRGRRPARGHGPSAGRAALGARLPSHLPLSHRRPYEPLPAGSLAHCRTQRRWALGWAPLGT